MAGVSSRLFEEMHQHPPKVDERPIADLAARIVEAGGGHHSISSCPRSAVGTHCGCDGVRGARGIVWNLDGVTGEPVLDPKDLCTRHVLHQPEQGCPGADKPLPRRFVTDSGDLANQRFTLILEKR